MNGLRSYLQLVKENLSNVQNFNNIHLVLGNESCDIDSSVSSLILAYLLHVTMTSNDCICTMLNNSLVVPVQNVPKDNFIYRSDNCYLYKEIGLPLDLLVYRDQLNFEELVSQKNVTTTLVDHHVLGENDKVLENTVIQIFDHRPRDPAFVWDENKVTIKMLEVGSCSTLIADKILSSHENILFKELGFLLYASVVYDTQALSPESGRAKELDHHVVDLLNKKFKFDDDEKTLFDKLWKAHNDVSHLTLKQILMKDLKIVENIPVPGLPMLVEDFLKLDESYTTVKNFTEEHKVSLIVLIGLDASNGIKRDIAVFSKMGGEKLRDKLLEMLNASQNYDFKFRKIQTSYPDIVCFRQENVKLSRKQIIPIIKDAVHMI